MDGVHVSDTEIRFQRRKLAVHAQHGPNTRTGGCWPVHTGDVDTPTLSRCNVTSWYVTRAVVWPPPAPRAGLTCV